MSDHTLLLDIGNSFTKHCYFSQKDDIGNLKVNKIANSDLESLLESAKETLICSVKNEEFNQDLAQKMDAIDIPHRFLKSQKIEYGLVNSYLQVENMGDDRWVGMLGAKALTRGDFILIDAGTAITVEAVAENKHLGGWIVAGLATSKQTLISNTERVFSNTDKFEKIAFGNDTPDCVEYGALASAAGLILCATELMQEYSKDFVLLISGGDGKFIRNHLPKALKMRTRFVSNIVLTGLAAIVKQSF